MSSLAVSILSLALAIKKLELVRLLKFVSSSLAALSVISDASSTIVSKAVVRLPLDCARVVLSSGLVSPSILALPVVLAFCRVKFHHANA